MWHEVECGGYVADLGLWEELASETAEPILELGCGTGRVGLPLARRGHSVAGIDRDTALVAAFNKRASELPAIAEIGDARGFELGRRFGLVLAPMQLIQLLSGEAERAECLACAASHLRPGGTLAVAIVENLIGGVNRLAREPSERTGASSARGGRTALAAEEVEELETGTPPLPDVREVDGWVYSSLPLSAETTDEEIIVRRLRQTVAPDGELSEEVDEVRLCRLTAEELEHEAEAAGLRPTGRRAIPATDAHVGSTVVLLERGA